MSSTAYTFKPKTATPSSGFYKPSSSSSGWGSKPAPPPEPKVDVKDYTAFPSLGSSLPPRASLRLPSKELPPQPKLGAWTAVAAKPATAPPAAVAKPEVPRPTTYRYGQVRPLTEEEAMELEACPLEERAACLEWIMNGGMEEEEGGEDEFNAHLASNRRRGDKGVW
jgi:hypothetical protein